MKNNVAINNSKDVRELKWLEQATHYMDSVFRIPGTNIRFGLDPVVGLVPFVGEIITFCLSGTMVLSMVKYGASRKVIMLMIGNILIDSIIGSIPLIGDLFDFTYKANRKNLKLLKEHQLEGKHTGSGTGILIAVALVLLALLFLVIFGLWKLGQYFVNLFQ
jgi:MFS superfamily sulfate permease-like transporter